MSIVLLALPVLLSVPHASAALFAQDALQDILFPTPSLKAVVSLALRLVSLAAILSLLAPAVSTITTYSIAVATRHVPRPTTNH